MVLMDASRFSKVNWSVLKDVDDNQMFRRFLKGRFLFIVVFLS